MTARDDYPWRDLQNDMPSASGRYTAMCDEIDRHRAAYADYTKALEMDRSIMKALDELIETLTTHADAMCALLVKVRDGTNDVDYDWQELNEAIRDYTDFMEEC